MAPAKPAESQVGAERSAAVRPDGPDGARLRALEERMAELEAEVARRVEVERTLRESENRFRLLAENSVDVVWSMDLEGRFTYVSPSIVRLRGYTPQEAMEQPLERMLLPEGLKLFHEQVGRVLADLAARGDSDRSGTFEIEMPRKDGTRVWTEVTASVMRDLDGKVVGIQGTSRDITWRRQAEEERRRLQEQLLQAQKLESVARLAGGVAHDFNNLLSVILNGSGFALDTLPEDHPARPDLLEVIRAAERAASLVHQLLAFSRRQALQPVPLNLNRVIAGIEEMLHRVLGEDIELVCRPAPDLWLVRADPARTEQLLMNLAVNARDAMPDGGRLVIETGNVEVDAEFAGRHHGMVAGPHVLLSVADTGCGMDEQTRARIFEPFFTTKDRNKGTGLGLSTVHGIVQQSGGHLWVYSELGKGTVVKIYLPREPAAAEVEPPPPAVAPARLTGDETILVVENEPAVREVAARALRAAGYSVLLAADGEEALRVVERFAGPVHLLLTDVVMPRLGGWPLAQRLVAAHPGLKVVYMSGFAGNVVEGHEELEAGASFLAKPFTTTALVRKIRETLDAGVGAPARPLTPPPGFEAEPPGPERLAAALRDLPVEARARLREAVVAARRARILELLDGVAARWPAEAAELRRLADGFDYEALRGILDR